MLPEDFFKPWEHTAIGWEHAFQEIRSVQSLASAGRTLAWRGVSDSSYALHSSVYRRFATRTGVSPDEQAVVKFEKALLRQARRTWRFENLSALEIFAQVQHFGGPTRLLDVSFNPLVALWFAVEQKFDSGGLPRPDTDGRLFIFDVTDRQVDLDSKWGGYELPWETQPDKNWRRGLPLVWRPPSYNDRIPAQNSAFLIGGVPQVYAGDNAKYRKGPGDGSSAGIWSISEVRQATSVTLSMTSLDRTAQPRSKPTFTLRIDKSGKAGIRQVLEKDFGFNVSSIYPDLYGLARYAADSIEI